MTFIAESYAVMTAAEIAAAEAAAVTAAEVAAAETARIAAAELAAQQAAQQTAQQGITAAPGAAPPPVGAPATPPPPAGGIETVAAPPPPSTPPPPAGGIETVATPPPPAGSTPAGLEQLGQQGFTNPEDAARFEQLKQIFSENPVNTGTSPFFNTASTVTSDVPAPLVQNTAVPPPPAPSIDPGIELTSSMVPQNVPVDPGISLAEGQKLAGSNPFLDGFNSVSKYIGENKFQSAVLATTGLGYMGAFKPPGTPMPEKKQYKGQYSLSPNFRATSPEPNVYQEKRYNYASGGVAGMQNSYDDENGSDMARGGIASFAKGTPRERDPEADFARYYALMEGQAPEQPPAPSYVGRVGIAYDDDKDTRYEDPLTAALIRQSKASKFAGIPAGPVIPRPKPLGTINLAPAGTRQAASGGIMGYNLGGYADGGNPRLLKGPGDGMSDNIPAVIGSRQPARLADGEFVVPADVVSHLGNGSTDAGAKKLHQMMDKIRMARTGKKKQAPAVKPKKYMPK